MSTKCINNCRIAQMEQLVVNQAIMKINPALSCCRILKRIKRKEDLKILKGHTGEDIF